MTEVLKLMNDENACEDFYFFLVGSARVGELRSRRPNFNFAWTCTKIDINEKLR